MRAEQTVSEMVVEVLARQVETLSDGAGHPFKEAFDEVLKTPAGRLLGELADSPHRHERAAEWQAGLLASREARRSAHLRSSSTPEMSHHEAGEGCYSWLGHYMEGGEETCARVEYHAQLQERFARLEP